MCPLSQEKIYGQRKFFWFGSWNGCGLRLIPRHSRGQARTPLSFDSDRTVIIRGRGMLLSECHIKDTENRERGDIYVTNKDPPLDEERLGPWSWNLIGSS